LAGAGVDDILGTDDRLSGILASVNRKYCEPDGSEKSQTPPWYNDPGLSQRSVIEAADFAKSSKLFLRARTWLTSIEIPHVPQAQIRGPVYVPSVPKVSILALPV